ncbi:MAG: hypothetical protein ABW076_00740 [Candidatus Thiodiazotropha sp.]
MTISKPLYDPSDESLDAAIELLTSIEPTDVGITSCYLDIDSPINDSLGEIQAEALRIGAELDATARHELDDAMTRIRAAVLEARETETRGLAIFSRSVIGGRFWEVIPSTLPFRNQLTYYRVPDVRPLLSLRDVSNEQFVVWSTTDGVELLRLRGGASRTLAWMAESQMQRPENEALESPVLKPIVGIRHQRTGRLARNTLSRLLRPVKSLQLIIAGDPERLQRLGDWLPRNLLSSVKQKIALSPYLARHKALKQIADQTASGVRDAVDAFASTCLRVPYLRGSSVAGVHKTLTALCARSLDLLLISSGNHSLSRLQLSASKLKRIGWDVQQQGSKRNTGFWHTGIEFSRLACQQQIPVLVTHNDHEVIKDGVGGVVLNQDIKAAEVCRPLLGVGDR